MEMLVAIGIMVASITIVTLSFSKLNANQALDKSADLAVSVLNESRSLTLSAKNGYQYGVNLESDQLVLFRGSSYSAIDSNNSITTLNALVGMRNISLSGGGTNVIFKKLSGQTDQSGTFEVYLKASTTNFRTIYISGTGAIESN